MRGHTWLPRRSRRFLQALALAGLVVAPLALWLFGASAEALLYWASCSSLLALFYAMEDHTPIERWFRKRQARPKS